MTFKKWWKRHGKPWWQGLDAGLYGSGGVPTAGHMQDLAEQAYLEALRTVPVAVRDLWQERARQLHQEHYSAQHDDQHQAGELAQAAAVYALPHGCRVMLEDPEDNTLARPQLWPWTTDAYRPSEEDGRGRRRELVKAGALIIAELERLDRADPALDEER